MGYEVPVFISHSWSYSDHYETLAGWIFEKKWTSGGVPIRFYNVSVPRDNPIHNAPNQAQLNAAILDRINLSVVVVIPTGMYVNYSKWIGKEIEGANKLNKPILGVNPWGQEKKSAIVAAAAKKTVGWTTKGVIDGVWALR